MSPRNTATSAEDKAEALLAPMLKRTLFAVFWHGKDKDLRPLLGAHLEYLIKLEKAGKVFASGPLGAMEKRNGLTILRARDEKEAARLAANDPFVKAGIRDFSVEPWVVMEGTLSVTVNFSDGSYAFE